MGLHLRRAAGASSGSLNQPVEEWPFLDQAVLVPSGSRRVCMTCHWFRHHAGVNCIPLLSNAIQHSPAGGAVRLELEQRNHEVALRMHDSGPGIAAGEQARIFDRFTRVDPPRSRQQGGTGLGRAIAQAIARRHGGLIKVRSSPGAGSTFSVQLPASG